MSKGKIYKMEPMGVELEEGKSYNWCRCGNSKNQPFCDGSHMGSEFNPVEFKVDKSGTHYLCLCKQTDNPPYCDGTHSMLDDREVDQNGGVETNSNLGNPSHGKEPDLSYIKELASGRYSNSHHGRMDAMGVDNSKLPRWDDIHIKTAQLAKRPLMDGDKVSTKVVIGRRSTRPLILDIPILVTDMSFGALSYNAKVALAKGADLANTAICSGEGGMLDDEQRNNKRYLYEYGSGGFGFDFEKLKRVQGFHFKGGQAAKTGTGGHLSANKVTKEIAKVRGLEEGEDAISPATFPYLRSVEDFRLFGEKVRKVTGGIPIGFKISANDIEGDIQFAIDAGTDYIILDGRGGGTGAAPTIFRDHISIPTIPALARAKRYLQSIGRDDISLIITGGLRKPEDFFKALSLGADAIAIGSSALFSIGCVSARICHTNLCPAGIATQDPNLSNKIDIERSAKQLYNFLHTSNNLIKTLCRGVGVSDIGELDISNLTTWKKEITELSGVYYSGVNLF